jgi:hypothetical protein
LKTRKPSAAPATLEAAQASIRLPCVIEWNARADGRDGRDPRRQSVHVVEQVEGVGDPDDQEESEPRLEDGNGRQRRGETRAAMIWPISLLVGRR